MRSLLWPALVSLLVSTSGIVSRADLILPPSGSNRDETKAIAVKFRIVNRGPRPAYIQGIRQDQDHLVLNFFYHADLEGWKPFIDYLPCDSPLCDQIGGLPKPCPKGAMIPIGLGPSGSPAAMVEYLWEGRLYERTEALMEHARGQYCYRPVVPRKGTLRVEVEYSESLSDNHAQPGEKAYPGRIGPRAKSAIELSLPPTQPVMEISLFEAAPGGESGRSVPR